MKSLLDVLQLSSAFLQKKGIERARRLSEDLLAHLLSCKRIDLYMQFDRPMLDEELVLLKEWLKRVAKEEPVEYVLGEVPFFGCTFRVDSRVLIPRPETEILVDFVSKNMGDAMSLWDLCTGSGCIGISLKKKFPQLHVTLSDISSDALSLAQENIQRNDVSAEVILGDFTSAMQGRAVDILVCNPPYVSSQEFLALDRSVRDFEPKLALLGGERGVEFYERLARDAGACLKPHGKMFLEIGSAQGKAVQEIFASSLWKKTKLVQDWSGKDRFFFLEKQ